MYLVESLPLVPMCVHDPQADGWVCWVWGPGGWDTSLAVQGCTVDQCVPEICGPGEVGTWCLGVRSSVCCTVDQWLAENARSRGYLAAGLESQQHGSNALLHYLLSGSVSIALLGEAVPLPPHCAVNRVYNSNMCHWKPNCSSDALLFQLSTYMQFLCSCLSNSQRLFVFKSTYWISVEGVISPKLEESKISYSKEWKKCSSVCVRLNWHYFISYR